MGIHVIIGEDDYLVDEAAKRIFGDGIGLETIDSANATNAELQMADIARVDESLSTPPFLDPEKTTWWKNVHFLPGGKASEDVKSALEAFSAKLASADLPDNQRFILSAPHLLKTSTFAKRLSETAEFVFFAAEKPWEAERNAVVRAIDAAEEANMKFAPGAAEAFVSVVGTDARSIASEIQKMRNYLGPRENVISSAAVGEVASPGATSEPMPWSVTDAVGRRDIGAALSALSGFERMNGFAVFMSGVLERFFRQLYDVSCGRASGLNPYVLKKSEGFLRKWTAQELRAARARFMALREKVVSGTSSGDVLVVTTLVRAMRRVRT